MSMSSTTILSKLEELRKWQEKQQERLLEQHSKRLEQNNFTEIERDFLQNSLGVNVSTDKNQKTTSLVASPPKFSKKPMPKNSPPQESKERTIREKQPFLRRGAGLTRFRMHPGEQFKPFTTKPFRSKTKFKGKPSLTPLKAPDLHVKPRAAWVSPSPIQKPEIQNLETPIIQSKRSQEDSVSLNASERELQIFETLEQRAVQNSFCSTNSSIVRLLSSSTPQKGKKTENYDQIDGVYPHQQAGDGSSIHEQGNYEQKLQNEMLDLIEKAIKFKEFISNDEVSSYSSTSSITSEDLGPEYVPKSKFNDDKEWSDAETSVGKSSSLKTLDACENKRDMETMTDDLLVGHVEEEERELLENRFLELEQELKIIQKENGKISKLKEQLDQQRREFEKHQKEIVKQVEDERVRIGFDLEEEKKKLAKQKMIFERHVKETLNRPSRKEREEISVLKSEISALRETLKMKETKNGLSLARLRTQIKRLETENASLKSQVEKLTIQNGKLQATNKLTTRKPTDTKILHEINKNITKLTQEKFNRKSVENSSSDEEEAKAAPKKSSGTVSKSRSRHLSESDEKENEPNIPHKSKSTSNLDSIQEAYDRTFKDHPVTPAVSEVSNERTETTLPDGSKHIEYKNGNIKTVSPGGNRIRFKYYNGDVKETNLSEGTIKYYYHASKVNHTTNADGSELIEFPNGQTEKRLRNSCEVQYPNGIVRRTKSTGTEEICYPDGTAVRMNSQGDRILELPNGQKEIHTKEHKRREYPDGTVKILYPDGLQETRYANGRVRLKDKHGKLLMDSHNPDEV